MEKICFAIKDNVSGSFEDPFYMNSRGEAVRGLRVAVNSKQETKLSMFAEDLSLYQIGFFDAKTGDFKPAVDFVCNAVDLKEN